MVMVLATLNGWLTASITRLTIKCRKWDVSEWDVAFQGIHLQWPMQCF